VCVFTALIASEKSTLNECLLKGIKQQFITKEEGVSRLNSIPHLAPPYPTYLAIEDRIIIV